MIEKKWYTVGSLIIMTVITEWTIDGDDDDDDDDFEL